MVAIGNFFFKYRNWIFILFYAALFIPSWPLFSRERFGEYYYYWPIIIGLLITCLGQLIRGLTIGLAYIVRGGKEGKPYAEGLVTEGIFNHCRNPLYVGNILMLLGVGILANSLVYVAIVIPVFFRNLTSAYSKTRNERAMIRKVLRICVSFPVSSG